MDRSPPFRRAVFTDRDGTLNPDVHYLSDPERIEFLPGVIRGIALLREHGYLVLCVTNQSGIGRGYFTAERLEEIHRRIARRLEAEGAPLDGFYYCPHHPEDRCACRKPGVALFLQAAREHRLDLATSAIIGDRVLDMEVGRTLGMVSAFVPERGLEASAREELRARGSFPELTAGTFLGAALQILSLG
ncbi:MAG: D-glycero-alpha-D-manno-heptose-1,7-bisphosphate 7-phosphatase [Thermoplasmata archaeon]